MVAAIFQNQLEQFRAATRGELTIALMRFPLPRIGNA
jgi:hypothetical protein